MTLKPEQGEGESLSYDAVVAADGARSPIRDYLVEDADLQCDRNYAPEAVCLRFYIVLLRKL